MADGFLRGVRDTYALTFHMTWQYEKKTRKRAYVSRDFLRDTYAFQGPFGRKNHKQRASIDQNAMTANTWYYMYRLCQTTRHWPVAVLLHVQDAQLGQRIAQAKAPVAPVL